MKTTRILAILVLTLGVMVVPAQAGPVGTAFTYQGRLMDADEAAEGDYDFEFKLYDSPADGNELGDTIDINDLGVIDGYFTVLLDFGSNVFDGNAVWLEIGVRPGDVADPFTILSPRQEVTATPYTLQTRGIFVDNALNVGIGTTSPVGKLHVDGGKAMDGTWGADIVIKAQDGGDGWAMQNNGAAGGDIILLPGEGGAESGVGSPGPDGNVGIGTTSPEAKLGIASPLSGAALGVGRASAEPSIAARSDASGGWLIMDSTGSGKTGLNYYDDGDVILVHGGGNVGIGTTSPRTGLEVLGTTGVRVTTGEHPNVYGDFKHAHSGGLIINAHAGGGGWADMSLQTNATTRMFIESGGNVGIGITGPSQKLHVAGTIYSSSGGFRFPDNTVQTTAASGGAQYWESFGDSIRNTNASNVGIGVSIPTSKLTVGGDIFVKSANGRVITPVLEIIGGSDLSEQFDIRSDEQGVVPSAGMVVSIDSENPGKLVVSSEAYDRKVAGIISGAGGIKPGMLMGQKGSVANGANPVALTGRVYCLVDAAYGAIQPGDLLTTSETSGHAMKVTDYSRAQGAILGKAMTSLENGKGQVLVLVTLQ